MKTRHRKTTKAKPNIAPKPARRSHSPAAKLQEHLDRRTRELDEALAHQAATSEVLNVIRRSPADAQPVFDAIVQSAARLCGANFSVVYLYDGDRLRIAATKNFTPEAKNLSHALQQLKRPDRSQLGGRAILDRKLVHVPDVLADPEYSRELALAGGWRAVLAVPLLHDGKPVGAISIAKAEPTSFSDQQIQLLNTFANQAVIAIENVRLFEAEQLRTRELAESLERQTATSEVLKVISSSPGELEPVFKAMLENATKLCGASYGTMWLKEGEGFRAAARHGTLPVVSTEGGWTGTSFQPRSDIPLARCARTRTAVHVTDMREEQSYLDGDPWIVSGVDEAGVRSLLAVPMLKDNEPVGAIGIYRTEVRSFSDKQIELVTNFAAQAVIAIENARLFSELRESTTGLTESLEQQTAISEVLQIIASSPGELKPILQAMLANATRLCKASYGGMWLKEGDRFRNAGFHGPLPEAFLKQWRNATVSVTASLVRVAQSRKPFQITDLRQDRSYLDGHPLSLSAVHVADILTVAFVPMLKGDEFVGVICVYRKEVRPFTDKQIELVQNFANQTIIALEQARLLNELRQSLQQQTATAEVLKIISRSAFDLPTVLQTLVESAARLCDADKASIIRERDGAFYRAEAYGFSREYLDYVQHFPVKPDRGSASGRALLEGRVIHIAD